MARGKNGLSELSKLLKLDAEARTSDVKRRVNAHSPTSPHLPDMPSAGLSERFADYYREWREFSPPTETDRALFIASNPETQPLKKQNQKLIEKPRPSPHPTQREADELDALHASQLALYPSPMSWDLGVDLEDEQSFLRVDVNPDLLRKLRKGHWAIQGELDLHHHTQDQAHEALAVFIRFAQKNEWRCVRIIHGKGLSSHNKLPVLRGKVRRWLQQKIEVLAYCEPRPNGGGSGAVLVLLGSGK